jgi:hypothetical protein
MPKKKKKRCKCASRGCRLVPRQPQRIVQRWISAGQLEQLFPVQLSTERVDHTNFVSRLFNDAVSLETIGIASMM